MAISHGFIRIMKAAVRITPTIRDRMDAPATVCRMALMSDRESGRHPDHEPVDQEHDRAGAPHGGKRFRSHELPDDHGVRHIVKLLEHIADKDRKCEAEDHFHRTSRCHVMLYCLHKKYPFCYKIQDRII